MLELKHITYTVSTPEGEQTILNDISIDIPDRKLIVFTGPNGGGKTTLAKVIMGLVTPTGGQILFNGQDITHLGITERARLGISYGFQQPPRFKGITVRNLLTIASGDANLSKDKCCKYLTQVGLCANDYLDREVDVSLSGGEVKRIEIATLLARGSELMIFDEPQRRLLRPRPVRLYHHGPRPHRVHPRHHCQLPRRTADPRGRHRQDRRRPAAEAGDPGSVPEEAEECILKGFLA